MNNTKQINILRYIILICVLILIGGLLITVANYIPVVEEKKSASMEEIESEGYFPAVPSMQGGYGSFASMEPTSLELATDMLMLKMAFYEGEDQGLEQAFRCYSTQYEEEYSRYWHGYVVVLRVLFLFFDYYEIRILNAVCQALLIGALAFQILQEKGKKYMLAFLTSYFLLMPMAVSQCLQYTWVFYVTFGALLLYIKHRSFWEQGCRYIYFFTIVGAVTIYLDLLTYPLLTWGLPLVWWILLQDKEETAIQYLKKVIFSGIAWILGYGSMWIGKWTLGSIVLRENLFRKAFSEALLWTVNEGEATITFADRLEAIYINWSTYEYKFYVLLLVLWLSYGIIKLIICGWKTNPRSAALFLIVISSFVWYLFLAGHTSMHHIFTHRIFGVSVAAFLGIVLISTEIWQLKREGLLYRGGMVCIAVLGAVLVMLQMKDEYYLFNGGAAFYEIVAENEVEIEFTPSYSEVRRINLGFRPENNVEGFIQLTLWDGEMVVDQLQLPVLDYVDGNFHELEVDWKLEPHKEYCLSLEKVDFGGDLRIWLSTDGQMVMTEFGETQLDDILCTGQILGGITYWCGFTDFSKKLVFAGAYLALAVMMVYAIYSTQNDLIHKNK